MASRAEQKAQLRAEREAREQAQAANAARRQRITMAGGIVIIAVVIAIVVIAIASHHGKTVSSKQATAPASAQTRATDARVDSLLAGIPQQSDNVLGNANAPVTIIEYGDLECSACDDFALATTVNTSDGTPGSGTEDEIINNLVRTGKAKLVYRSLETASSEDSTVSQFDTQQAAAYAAGLQNKGWYYVELFYNEQGEEGSGYVNTAYLTGIAKQIPGLDLAQWQRDRNSATLKNQVVSENAEGTKLDETASGGVGTPSIFIEGKSGQPQLVSSSVPTYAQVADAVKSAA